MQKADLSVLIGKQKTNVLFCVHCFYNLFQHRVNHLVAWIFLFTEKYVKIVRIYLPIYLSKRILRYGICLEYQLCFIFDIVIWSRNCSSQRKVLSIFDMFWLYLRNDNDFLLNMEFSQKKLNTANKSRYSTFFLQIFVMRNFSWLNKWGF